MVVRFGATIRFLLLLSCSVCAEPGTVYFKISTVSGEADTWTGSFEVADLSQTIESTEMVALSTDFVGGLNREPGFIFTSGADYFAWNGDNNPPGANSTIRSPGLVSVIEAGATWESLLGASFSLLAGFDATTDLSTLNPVFLRVSGRGGSVRFGPEPFSPSDPYAEWAASYQGLTETDKMADPDHDGYVNVMEFGFDGNPTVATASFLQVSQRNGEAVFTFVARNDMFPVNYHVLSTTNLAVAPFSTNAAVKAAITNAAAQTGVLITNEYTRKEFAVPLSMKEFFRVEAFLP